ncbi:mucin-like protein 3 [Macrotis lagotis]|uniref:mucin-like protein 3 n=1 Tax=Macrotis lagotis TaxID=92651 RepID=UPI003D690A07
MRTSFRTTTISYHEGLGASEKTTTHLDKTTVKDTGASERTTSLSQISNTSYEGTGTSDKTTTASPNTITRYHEGMEVSERTTLHLEKTIGNTPKDSAASERTTSLSQITNSSHEAIGASDRTSSVSPKITDISHKNMESSFRTTSVSPKTIITYHEGKGTSDRTTSVSLKITDTSQMETGISFRTHKGMGTSIIGDLNKATRVSNRTPFLTTIWTIAVSDKITESLGTSYKTPFASDKIIGTMEPTTTMESLDKTITLGGTSEKMTKSLEKTTDICKTATTSHQPLGASDKSTQISHKTRKASEVTGPLDKITHKSTSTPFYISIVPNPPFWVPSEKTFASFTTLNHNQELNSTKSINNKWPNQKTDNSREGSQNGSIQEVLEGNSFPAWAIVIVVLVAVILLLLLIGLLFMAVYIIRTRHHHMATEYEKNDAEDEVGSNSYPVFLMEQQALGRSQIPLP